MDGAGLPTTRSTCPYCGVGCGVLLRPDGQGGLDVRGDPDHPANRGKLCSKGSQLGQTLGLDDRLLSPKIDGETADWDSALGTVASRFAATIAEYGPDSVALYVSGQLLTEDYYVANKLAKGFFGTANIDTNSRLCMASTVAGHKRAFGTDTVPGTYDDLEQADLIVLTGSNLAWCHPVLYQRILAARKNRGTRIVVIDPRRTASCDGADLHLALAPGSDVALFNGLLSEIAQRGLIDADFAGNVTGLDEALATARSEDLSVTGLSDTDLSAFFDLWCGTEKVVTIFSQGVNQSTSGSDKVNAILNCHLATGRIGQPGTGPFSVTGQPNAMGGREVGGLANMLACHLDIENAEHRQTVQGFWSAPAVPTSAGLKAVDMFRAVGEGRIKALWIIHTNPAVSMPEADRVRDAIDGCDFVVVSDVTERTDTARLANVLLPATAWAEKSGTVTNSDRTISRQRAVLPAPGDARPDWAILAEVGRRMGWQSAFDYQSPAEIFREYAALSGFAARFGRDFDISGLQNLSDEEYDTLAPVRWPVTATRVGGRFFGDGRFFTPDGKARMLAVNHRAPAASPCDARPFVLNTGRLRDQWHTMTRTAKSSRLSAHLPEPFLEIHPKDAARLRLSPAALVRVENDLGSAILRARITDAVRPGEVFAPMHWTGETAPSARIDALVAGACDPVSGQPESKASTVSISEYRARWYGFAVCSGDLHPTAPYWTRTRTDAGYRSELAGKAEPDDWEEFARDLFATDAAVQIVDDPKRGNHRFAFHAEGRLVAALFVSRSPTAVTRDYIATLPGTEAPAVLSGRAPADRPDPGPTICSCFGVGMNTIVQAIEEQALTSVDAIGAHLQAGTNCGSCRAELAFLLEKSRPMQAAE
ncbi:molybdopterin-dependent oxidoreductase [Maritimibacter dapengensis]|uniref:Molybdopterin-dependent oxidoreductase n=1 Tax=Maritimibacter dapengensis TaxID=2836868 RepID=A0ABS6T3R5_9RHOB|nr:nitrate reductase [Maritimibacter dapengensis]MBV7379769.1 molybdopterin-dependent oxidoreductase [Maritimibacter dapengensis]